MRNFDLSTVIIQYVCLLFSLCVHEASHALASDRCGDPSARFLGRATLNPLAHIDPVGTVVLPLLMMATNVPFLFGWAKPVPFNPRNLGNMRRDPALIALAGPLSNLALAVIAALGLRLAVTVMGITPDMVHVGGGLEVTVFYFLALLVMTNLALMLFNLIPVPPLDGSHVLHSMLPPQGQRVLEQIGPFGIVIAILVARHVLGGPLRALSGLIFGLAFLGQ